MADDHYEPNRFLGFPVRTGRADHTGHTGQTGQHGQHARQGEESQRVMGFPVDWFGAVDRDQVWPLAHPIRGYR